MYICKSLYICIYRDCIDSPSTTTQTTAQRREKSVYLCIYIYMYICIYLYIYISIEYIVSPSTTTQATTERRKKSAYLSIYIYLYVYLCIYVYLQSILNGGRFSPSTTTQTTAERRKTSASEREPVAQSKWPQKEAAKMTKRLIPLTCREHLGRVDMGSLAGALALTRHCFTSKLYCGRQSSIYCPPALAKPTLLQYYCTPISQYTSSPTDPPFVCLTPYNMGDGNTV